jgi:fatty-acyl-CoA synthase
VLTIGRWLSDRARITPERIAIDYGGRSVTYAELDEVSDRFASSFAARGLERGHRIATLTGNSPEHVALFFACAKSGLVLTPLSWRLAAPELAYQLEDAEPAVFLVEEDHRDLAEAARWPFEPLAGAPGAGGSEPQAPPSDHDPLLLVYTSGTTGKPKGALLTHANCFWTNLGFDVATGVRGDDVVLQLLPQFHCGGWNVQPLLAWWKGATVVLERAFDAARCLALIEQKRVTTMMGVPAIYLFLAQEPGFDDADLSSLRQAVVGGAPMPEALLERWQERGVEIVQGYGLTEAAPNVLCLPPEDARRKLGFAGKPYPHVDVALRDPQAGALLAGPGVGELVVSGPNVFAGYWRNPDATAEAIDASGWFHTGDLGSYDERGYLRIEGRTKELIITGGYNVYPREVEELLLEHPAVAEVAVVGTPSEEWGEVVTAYVVASGEPPAPDDLLAFTADRLASFKRPRSVRYVDKLPRNALGKVLKHELGR